MTESQFNVSPEPRFWEVPGSALTIENIADRLTRIIRWASHKWNRPISVAGHSLRVCGQLWRDGRSPLLQLHGLLHDAAEAYTGDIVRPVKNLLSIDGRPFRYYEDLLMSRILQVLDVPVLDDPGADAVREADRIVGQREEARKQEPYDVGVPGLVVNGWVLPDKSRAFVSLFYRLKEEIRDGAGAGARGTS